MENPVNPLQLIIFTVDTQPPRTLLRDAIYHNPGYQPGDVIHLVRPTPQTHEIGADQQYVVLSAKHVVRVDAAKDAPNEYILLVEVAELAEAERTDSSRPLRATRMAD